MVWIVVAFQHRNPVPRVLGQIVDEDDQASTRPLPARIYDEEEVGFGNAPPNVVAVREASSESQVLEDIEGKILEVNPQAGARLVELVDGDIGARLRDQQDAATVLDDSGVIHPHVGPDRRNDAPAIPLEVVLHQHPLPQSSILRHEKQSREAEEGPAAVHASAEPEQNVSRHIGSLLPRLRPRVVDQQPAAKNPRIHPIAAAAVALRHHHHHELVMSRGRVGPHGHLNPVDGVEAREWRLAHRRVGHENLLKPAGQRIADDELLGRVGREAEQASGCGDQAEAAGEQVDLQEGERLLLPILGDGVVGREGASAEVHGHAFGRGILQVRDFVGVNQLVPSLAHSPQSHQALEGHFGEHALQQLLRKAPPQSGRQSRRLVCRLCARASARARLRGRRGPAGRGDTSGIQSLLRRMRSTSRQGHRELN